MRYVDTLIRPQMKQQGSAPFFNKLGFCELSFCSLLRLFLRLLLLKAPERKADPPLERWSGESYRIVESMLLIVPTLKSNEVFATPLTWHFLKTRKFVLDKLLPCRMTLCGMACLWVRWPQLKMSTINTVRVDKQRTHSLSLKHVPPMTRRSPSSKSTSTYP